MKKLIAIILVLIATQAYSQRTMVTDTAYYQYYDYLGFITHQSKDKSKILTNQVFYIVPNQSHRFKDSTAIIVRMFYYVENNEFAFFTIHKRCNISK